MRAAVVQFASGMDPAANREAATAAVERAARDGAALVVLPEAAQCGFGSATTDLAPLSEPLDGPFVAALAAVAGRSGATVIAGLFEPSADGRVHNTLVVVGAAGLLGAYRKVHLYDALGWCESDRVAAGDPGGANVPVVAVGDLAVGLLTCYDLRFPESARLAVDLGATVLAVPAAWVAGPHKEHHWRTLLGARAIENTCYVLAAAQPAPVYSGCSQIVDPFGVVVAQLGPDEGGGEPAFASGPVDPHRVAEARAALPVLAHRRFAVTVRETSPSSADP